MLGETVSIKQFQSCLINIIKKLKLSWIN